MLQNDKLDPVIKSNLQLPENALEVFKVSCVDGAST